MRSSASCSTATRLEDDRLVLVELRRLAEVALEAREARGARPSPSIDRLLASAADIFGERLIAVILSGMGSDGVVGAGEVKARGGTVIIQNPETAAQPSMPRALPPTLVAVLCFRGIRGPVHELLDWGRWADWFMQLDRSFLFLLILLAGGGGAAWYFFLR